MHTSFKDDAILWGAAASQVPSPGIAGLADGPIQPEFGAPIEPKFKQSVEITSAMIDGWVKQMTLADLVGDIRSPGYPDRLGHYQYANKGGIFFPCDPQAIDVHIEDIAQALSRIHRFNGQTKQNSTVAEHCYIASMMVPPEEALAALMHDSAEAYIGDMVRPLKYLPILGTIYLKIEAGIEQAIATKFLLPYPFLGSKAIHDADELLVGIEVRHNIASTAINHLTPDPEKVREATKNEEIFLYHWEPKLAEQMFLARFRDLTNIRGY